MTHPDTNTVKEGDWVVYDLKVGQVKRLRDDGIAEFSDGFCSTSGMNLADGFRPLSLRNKAIMETFDIYYKRLKQIDGNIGFNYPSISRRFAALALEAIDHDDNANGVYFSEAQEFIRLAREYTPVIQGISLFRRAA